MSKKFLEPKWNEEVREGREDLEVIMCRVLKFFVPVLLKKPQKTQHQQKTCLTF